MGTGGSVLIGEGVLTRSGGACVMCVMVKVGKGEGAGGYPEIMMKLDDKGGGETSSYIIPSQCFLIFNQV